MFSLEEEFVQRHLLRKNIEKKSIRGEKLEYRKYYVSYKSWLGTLS